MTQYPAIAWAGLANAYIKTHREQEGIRTMTDLLRNEPKNAHAHMLIANLHQSLREFDKVVEHHSAAIALGDDWNGQSYSRRGRAQASMGRFQEARADFEAALELAVQVMPTGTTITSPSCASSTTATRSPGSATRTDPMPSIARAPMSIRARLPPARWHRFRPATVRWRSNCSKSRWN